MVAQLAPKDFKPCVDLFLDVFFHPPWNYTWMTKAAVVRYFRDLQATPCFVGLVYRPAAGADVLGLCLGVTSDYFTPKIYDVKELAVGRAAQGRGHGRRMLAEAEDFLRRLDVTTVTLLTQRAIEAYGFYLKNGYEVAEDAVYMNKTLGGEG
jgi:GNAT superfamily N-acetyltransferase